MDKIKIILEGSRYSQFKKTATTARPDEAVHRAVKEASMKLKELKRTIEFASRMKNELSYGTAYKKRTAEALHKLALELKEISSTLKKDWKASTKPLEN